MNTIVRNIEKITIQAVFIFSLLIFSSALGKNIDDFENIWIPDSYKERAEIALMQATTATKEYTLLSKGFGIVIPSTKLTEQNLYEFESEAREKLLGLWSEEQYKVKTPDTINGYENSFQVIEGTIVNTSLRKDKLYLNFGEDWKTDFTIAIPKQALQIFKKAGLTPKEWSGKHIRVRGWVEEYNGAMMKVTNPVQINMLELEP